MKRHLTKDIALGVVLSFLGVMLLIWTIKQLQTTTPFGIKGETLQADGKVIGYGIGFLISSLLLAVMPAYKLVQKICFFSKNNSVTVLDCYAIPAQSNRVIIRTNEGMFLLLNLRNNVAFLINLKNFHPLFVQLKTTLTVERIREMEIPSKAKLALTKAAWQNERSSSCQRG